MGSLKVKYVLSVRLKTANKTQLKFSTTNDPLTTTTFFSPALVAFWVVVIVLPSRVTRVLQWRPSVVSSSNSSPILRHQIFTRILRDFTDLNFSSMLLTVVLVTIDQLPPSSEIVITGVEARAAFLRMKPTPRAFRKSSYFSEETCVYVPVMGAMAIWCCSAGVWKCSEVVWLLTARRLTQRVYTG